MIDGESDQCRNLTPVGNVGGGDAIVHVANYDEVAVRPRERVDTALELDSTGVSDGRIGVCRDSGRDSNVAGNVAELVVGQNQIGEHLIVVDVRRRQADRGLDNANRRLRKDVRQRGDARLGVDQSHVVGRDIELIAVEDRNDLR